MGALAARGRRSQPLPGRAGVNPDVNVCVNGEARQLPEGTTVAELLSELHLPPRRVAVERNKRIVRRARFAETHLQEDDAVEIVTLVGGG